MLKRLESCGVVTMYDKAFTNVLCDWLINKELLKRVGHEHKNFAFISVGF